MAFKTLNRQVTQVITVYENRCINVGSEKYLYFVKISGLDTNSHGIKCQRQQLVSGGSKHHYASQLQGVFSLPFFVVSS